MKYTLTIEIDKPVDEVATRFADPEQADQWMEGLQSVEPISGTPGQPGAQAEMTFQMGKRKMVMTETIKVNNLPDEFTSTYHTKSVFNIQTNRFEPLPGDRTKYISESEFQFKGFMKLMGRLMPGAFRKQSLKYMNDFKTFVEKQ